MAKLGINETVVEEAALTWFETLEYKILHGPEIAPGEPFAEREDYRQVVLEKRLRDAVAKLNPDLPFQALQDALKKVLRLDSPSLIENNRTFHKMLTDGVDVEIMTPDGQLRGKQVALIDYKNPDNNDWAVVNQYTVVDGQSNRRCDVVVFVNGLPLAVFELKNPGDEKASIWTAFNQFQTYKNEIPSLFNYNEILVVSDGLEARFGSLTANREWFLPWRTIEGKDVEPITVSQLEVLIRGIFQKERLLDYIRHFIVFEDERGKVKKKLAGYHQFHATRQAVKTTVEASSVKGDKRAGVVWHTQGAGKSLTMVFFTGKIVLQSEMNNPTIVVLTDRIDLDDQLFGVFSRCSDILRQKPIQAIDREDLREKLKVTSGGIVFTTIQKFFPEEREIKFPCLSERRNIVVIADEAHRSQYDFIDGFARHMRDALPNATFIAFTGTPIELEDRNTRAVFGDYIDVYDIKRAVEDKATVPIYYESRLNKLNFRDKNRIVIDEEFEEVTEGEEVDRKEKLKRKWAAMEAVVGTEENLKIVARDFLNHFERRLETIDGKAMIVCMSRRICVNLFNEIIKLRPEWQSEKDEEGTIKVIMTGSASDDVSWQQHIRNKARREDLAYRFKNPEDHFQVAIVRDMWLTGFDAPSLHTMYLIKPMGGHTLMQAIARVNRVYRDKPGGLIVDYLGLADSLRNALKVYTESGGEGKAVLDQDDAVAAMQERYEICRNLFHGFDYESTLKLSKAEILAIIPSAQEYILQKNENGKERFKKAVTELSQAFALAVPRKEAMEIRDEVAFFQLVKSALVKVTVGKQKPSEEYEYAIRQIVEKAIAPEGIIELFQMVGLKTPDISILSDEFLVEVKAMPQKNLAVELLRKLLSDEIKKRSRKNLVQSQSFAELLEETIRRYTNRAIETIQVIEELIGIAKQVKEADRRGEELHLTVEEFAFYSALETNDSAVKVMGDEVLTQIARDLTETVRKNTTIDWTIKESVKANLRRLVKRILRKYGYPPDKQEKATKTVIEQAKLLSEGLTE